MALFLLGDAAAYVTAGRYFADGGLSRRWPTNVVTTERSLRCGSARWPLEVRG